MNLPKYIQGVGLILLITLSSCSAYKTNLSIREPKLPNAYTHSSDSSNSAQISWKDFYQDSLLTALIDTAMKGNQDLQIALQRIEVARAGKRRTSGALFPQVGLQLNGGIRKFGLYTMDGAGNISTEMTPGQIVPIHLPDMIVGFQASWEIDIWGKLRNKRKAAFADFLSSMEASNLVISNLVADIANQYYTLIALDQEMEIIDWYIGKQEEILEVIQLQKATGLTNELAVLQFEAQLLESKAMKYEIAQQIYETENLINFLIGRYPQKIERNPNGLEMSTDAPLQVGVPSQLLRNRPDIRMAEYNVQASKFELKAAKAAFYPNINISAGMGFNAFNPSLLFNPASLAYSVIGNLFAPLINMSALKAQFHTAKAQQISAMHQYQKSILQGYTDVVNTLNQQENLLKIQELKQEQKSVLNESVTTADELFRNGKAAYLEILFSQQNALKTEIELIEINKRIKQTRINLYKAIGGGWN